MLSLCEDGGYGEELVYGFGMHAPIEVLSYDIIVNDYDGDECR